MEQIKQFIQQGQLQEAIEHCHSVLKKSPMDVDMRGRYIELLCIAGELDIADKQINLLIKQSPEAAIGGLNVQQLLRAQQSRVDFANGAATAEVFSAPDAELAAIVALQLATRENDKEAQIAQCAALEANRTRCTLQQEGTEVTEIRDLDDTLAGYLEVFGTNGKYYLVKYAELKQLTLKPVTSLIELVWRRVEIDIVNGPSGDAFIPVTYLLSQTDAEKLGRETDWQAISDQYFRGVGLKMLLINDAAVNITELPELRDATAIAASDVQAELTS